MRRWGLRLAGAAVAAGLVLAAAILPRPAAEPAAEPEVPAATGTYRGSPADKAAPQAAAPKKGKGKAKRATSLDRLDGLLARKMPSVDPDERLRLSRAIFDEARGAAIDPLFVAALIAVESGFDHGAESVRGARGLMQLRPSTLESEVERSDLGTDLNDPVVNVRAGIRYYVRLLKAFGDHDVALMAYNAGPNRILKYLREEGSIPERFHPYAAKVQQTYSRFLHATPPTPAPAPAVAAPAAPGKAPGGDGTVEPVPAAPASP